MTSEPERFSRWADGGHENALDRELGELFHAVPQVRALGSRELAEVAARLRPTRVTRPPALARYALLLGVGMLAGAAFAVAGHGVKRWVEPAPVAPRKAPAASDEAVKVRAEPARAVPAAVESAAPTPLESAATPALAPPVASTRLGRESELLARALTKLRGENHPAGALSLLDQYRSEFPHGALALESEVARLDAFLALGRQADALRLLDTLPLERTGRSGELRVVRAELRARVEPARAIADFDQALAAPLAPALDERARFGRAASRLRAGDQAGAARDLRDYLERYPNGRFAVEARARLGASR